jgi:hypothetical protein
MKDIKVSYSFSKGYQMIAGTLLMAGVAGMISSGFKLNRNLTILCSVGGLVFGAYLSLSTIRKIENPNEPSNSKAEDVVK